MAFPPLGNSDHGVVSFSIDFPINSEQDASFHRVAYACSRADWDGLRDHLRDVPWEDIFKPSASAAGSEFCEWVQVGIDVYIPHRMYQVKPHSAPWFSAACAAAMVHRNHIFRLYQQNKSSESKVNFRQASNRCKRVLEAAKLVYATKTKVSITSQKLGSRNFWRIANSILNKGKSAIPPVFNGSEVVSSASDRAKLFARSFTNNSNHDNSNNTERADNTGAIDMKMDGSEFEEKSSFKTLDIFIYINRLFICIIMLTFTVITHIYTFMCNIVFGIRRCVSLIIYLIR